MIEAPQSPPPMLPAHECLERAAQIEAMAAQASGTTRTSFLSIAEGWRRVALMARHQDSWTDAA